MAKNPTPGGTIMYAITTLESPLWRVELQKQGFELAPASAVGHRLIITGRMVGGSMHSILPTLELVAVDRDGAPVLHVVHASDPVTANAEGRAS
jgi:hypothetical protein